MNYAKMTASEDNLSKDKPEQKEQEQNKPAFACKKCGQCCFGDGGIVVSRREIRRLADGLCISATQCREKYLVIQGEKTVLKTSEQGYCIFFEEHRGCLVHGYKPDICRAWPFFKGNLVDRQSWTLAQDYCPGINPGLDHSMFVKQGIAYIIRHDLIRRSPDQANSLLNQNELNKLKDAI